MRQMGSTVPLMSMAGWSGGPVMAIWMEVGRRTCIEPCDQTDTHTMHTLLHIPSILMEEDFLY